MKKLIPILFLIAFIAGCTSTMDKGMDNGPSKCEKKLVSDGISEEKAKQACSANG